ncbi:MAG: tetratricopeptide repeat protein [Candidatus Aminicenantes bacterium]|nr:tetratricopeptide repeat protein [Candidatus Aminicenantes bacterium]
MLPKKIISAVFPTILFFSPPSGAPASQEDLCEKARAYARQALELKENSIELLLKKEDLYRKAVDLCPSFAQAHNNLGDVFEKQERFEEAIAQYQKAAELDPRSPYPYFGLGDIYFRTDRYREAVQWYEKGLENRPAAFGRDEQKEFELTAQRLALARDILKNVLVKSVTLRGMMRTRGPGEIVSISFGERLIPFDFDKSDIRPDARPQLDEIGKALREELGPVSKEETIEVIGHADIRGSDEYNLRLTEKRAKAVIDYLVDNFGLPRDRLKPIGCGERQPLCRVDETDACHALNRRVEIIRRQAGAQAGATRTLNLTKVKLEEAGIALDTGFFWMPQDGDTVKAFEEGTPLRSRSDRYFVFFRPLQDCYVYVLQEDSSHRMELLYPGLKETARVKKGKDYWIPRFGESYTLDDIKGDESLCLIASSFSLDLEPQAVNLGEKARSVIRSLQTRIIKISRPEKAPPKIKDILDRVEGSGSWVRIVKFRHE